MSCRLAAESVRREPVSVCVQRMQCTCVTRDVCVMHGTCVIHSVCVRYTGRACDTGGVCDARCVCTHVPNIRNTGPCIQSVTHRHPRVYINTRTHSKRTQKGFSGAVLGPGPWSWRGGVPAASHLRAQLRPRTAPALMSEQNTALLPASSDPGSSPWPACLCLTENPHKRKPRLFQVEVIVGS